MAQTLTPVVDSPDDLDARALIEEARGRQRRRRLTVGIACAGLIGVVVGAYTVFNDGSDTTVPRRPPAEAGRAPAAPPSPQPTAAPAPVGYLQRPSALAAAPDASLLIADGARIVRRAPDGTFSVLIAEDAGLVFPRSIAVAPDGAIVVADSDAHAVRRIAGDGTVIDIAALGYPMSVAFAPDGTLFVVDTLSGVWVILPDGSRTMVIANGFLDVRGATMAFFPSTVTVDDRGHLFVADSGVKLLGEFAPDGTLLGALGPQVYVSPGSGLATTHDGSVVVAEWGGWIERIVDGQLVRLASPYRANGIAAAPDGTIWFTVNGGSGFGLHGPSLWSIDPAGTVTRVEPR